ncbi:CGNR zinc finger domain-containing protein [Streptomyces sp. CA2R106]|uniref:CGNR zinc finger domain-containing protein n=1 Tax=Streptomyces sp. CA2R106 TaxID=3120153 RepID=UPI003009D629
MATTGSAAGAAGGGRRGGGGAGGAGGGGASEVPDAASGESGPGFRFVGGRVCLDFVATLGKRHTDPVERLPEPAALARWFDAAGLLPTGAAAPQVGAAGLAQARVLREALNRLVRAAMAGRPYSRTDIAVVNRVAVLPDLAPQLAVGDQAAEAGGAEVRWQHRGPVAGAALATVARDGVLLLGGPVAGRVKECGNPVCSLLFVDDSQAGRRRWCSMERCGNLAKVAGYRARARRRDTAQEAGAAQDAEGGPPR